MTAKPKSRDPSDLDLKKIFFIALAVYALMIVGFYFLSGDQLHFRRSRGELTAPAADAGAVELTQGVMVEQIFWVKIQRFESVSVQWSTYYRSNIGVVTMEFLRQDDETVLMRAEFDAAAISDI